MFLYLHGHVVNRGHSWSGPSGEQWWALRLGPGASGFIIDSALLEQHHHAAEPVSQAIKVFVGCKQARCAWATCSIDTRQVRNERPLIAVCAEH